MDNIYLLYIDSLSTVESLFLIPFVKQMFLTIRSGSSSSSSVQDQLDDLTELLKTALNEDTHKPQQQDVSPPRAQFVDAKNPGKLNPNFIDDLQGKMETSAKKVCSIVFLVSSYSIFQIHNFVDFPTRNISNVFVF